jgi:hypothetical protein
MRIAVVLLTVVLLAGLGAVPASSATATKYKPCTLLTSADLEGALKGKLSRAPQEGESDDNESGPFQGEIMDYCSWIVISGSDAIGVVLRVTRATSSISQMAQEWTGRFVEKVKKAGGTVEVVKIAGTECHIFGNTNKNLGATVGYSTNCLTAGKGRALLIEINIPPPRPVPAAVNQGLFGKAVARLC